MNTTTMQRSTPREPGWYLDLLEHRVVERWWSGRGWTDYVRPLGEGKASMPRATSAAPRRAGRRLHLLHAALTITTCGLWAPMWLLCCALNREPRR